MFHGGVFGDISKGRGGAGNEGTGSNFAGDCQKDQSVAAAKILGSATASCGACENVMKSIGQDGLMDRRRGRPSAKRVPLGKSSRCWAFTGRCISI